MHLQKPSRWLVPYSFIVTMIIATIVILHLLEKCIVHASEPEAKSSVALVPSISIQVNWMDAVVLLASSIGMWGIAQADQAVMRAYFYFLVSFVGLQLIVAAAVLQNKDQYVENNLRQSWIRAFDTDPRIILDIQREFRCQGFDEPAELMVEMPEFYGALMACKYALIARFGPKMYSIGVMTMIIRLIQFGGIFVLSFVLHQIRTTDCDDTIEQTCITLQNELLPTNEKVYQDEDNDSTSVDLISFNDEEKFIANNDAQSFVAVQIPANTDK